MVSCSARLAPFDIRELRELTGYDELELDTVGERKTALFGMSVGRVMGAALSDTQMRELFAGKRILLKGLRSKTGRSYDAYVTPNGTEEYRYTKDGEERRGVRFKFVVEFAKRKVSGRRNG